MKTQQSSAFSLRKIARFTVLCAILVSTSACSHMSYSRGIEDNVSRANPEKRPDTKYESKLDMNEIQLVDTLGIFCAALAETSEQIGNERAAYQEAVRDRKYTYEYSWRSRSPSEFQGMSCGAYYKWGSSSSGNFFSPDTLIGGDLYSSTYGEGGLSVSGASRLVDDWEWLRGSIGARLGMGRFTHTFDATPAKQHNQEWTLRVPMELGLHIYPDILFGLGIEGFAGADLVGWALSSGNGKVTEKFDYGARIGYTFTTTYVALSAYAGWERRNYTWGEFWTQHDAFGITTAIDLNYFEMF